MAQPRPTIRIQNFTGEEIEIVLIQIKIHIARAKMLQIIQNSDTQRIIINDKNFRGMIVNGQKPKEEIEIQVQFQPHISTEIRTYWSTLTELDKLEVAWTTYDKLQKRDRKQKWTKNTNTDNTKYTRIF